MRILLIANPTAGQGRVRWIAGFVQSALERYGAHVTLVLTGGPRDAEEASRYALRSGRFDRIVAAGGDGTINQVVGQLVGRELPLAILPLGTANSLAREIRMPRDLIRSARIAVTGAPVLVDVGKLNDRYFILEVSAGFDASVVASVRLPLKKWLGPVAYVVTGLRLMRTHAPFDVRITADGRPFETRANVIIAANSATYVYGLRLVRNASIHDGLLDLCILESGVHRLPNQVFAACCNRLGPSVGARTIQAREFLIETEPIAAVQMDGDPAGQTPIRIECVPHALNLVAPERFARRCHSALGSASATPAGSAA